MHLIKDAAYTIAVLAIGWIILREYFSPWALLVGVLLGVGCVYFYHKFLPERDDGSKIHYFRLVVYLIFLFGQIYKAGLFVIKVILTGAKADIVQVKTTLTNESLRVILANSITLTPGSILLDLTDDTFTLLWLREKNDNRSPDVADAVLKNDLEAQLLKVQK